jgi:hypothetical protein
MHVCVYADTSATASDVFVTASDESRSELENDDISHLRDGDTTRKDECWMS